MVRLEEESRKSGTASDLFQFQYGTIRRPIYYLIHHFNFDFNSSMVRLEADTTELLVTQHLHFNSSMVRLEANENEDNFNWIYISIPVWYD